MAFLQVQNKTATATAASTVVITPNSALTVNNLVVVGIKFTDPTMTLVSVTDSAGNTYTTTNDLPNTQGASHYLAYGVQVVGGATTVTVTANKAGNHRVTLGEYSGGKRTNATIFDVGSSGNGASGTAHTVTTFTPAAAGELIVAHDGNQSGAGTYTAGTNYTLGGNTGVVGQEYDLAGTTSETCPFTYSTSSGWGEIAAAFKEYVAPAATLDAIGFGANF